MLFRTRLLPQRYELTWPIANLRPLRLALFLSGCQLRRAMLLSLEPLQLLSAVLARFRFPARLVLVRALAL